MPKAEPLAPLAERQAAAAELVARLHDDRAAAALEGRPYDLAALRAAEDAQEALDAAGVLGVRREREAAQRAAQEARREALSRATLADAARRSAIEKAEAAARSMAAALAEAEARRKDVASALADAAHPLPVSLMAVVVEKRRSEDLSAVLAALSGSRFGHLALQLAPFATSGGGAWLDREPPAFPDPKEPTE